MHNLPRLKQVKKRCMFPSIELSRVGQHLPRAQFLTLVLTWEELSKGGIPPPLRHHVGLYFSALVILAQLGKGNDIR